MRSSTLTLLGLSLLLLCPATALAQWDDELPEEPPPGVEAPAAKEARPPPPVKPAPIDIEDDEEEQPAPKPEPVAEPARPPPEPRRSAPAEATDAPRRESRDVETELVEKPRVRLVTVGVCGAIASLGGFAFPKLAFSGNPDNNFHAFGAGGAFTAHVDLPMADLDWRFGVQGALPGYLGAQGTVGIKKEVGPWENPKVTARGGGGIELMVAGLYAADNKGNPGYAFLVPVVLGAGETAVDFEVVKNRFRLGGALELAARFGLPIGFGFNAAGWLRAQLMF